jgi:4-alpha-glucanotransferase
MLVWTEWEIAPHKLDFSSEAHGYIVDDMWRPIPDDLPLYSSAYTECIGVAAEDMQAVTDSTTVQAESRHYPITLQLRVVEPRLRKGECLGICGSSPQLGEWQTPQRMKLIALQEWSLNIDAALLYNEVEYKYVVLDHQGNILRWEEGTNRTLRSPQLQMNQLWVKTDHRPRLNYPNWKAAGVVIPVFSLRSEGSFGVGDFGDLKALIEWAVRTKMHAIQILPINDTMNQGTWKDSYPYNAISIFAFHPIYCDLRQLPRLADKLKMEKFMMAQQKLNSLPRIDYERVIVHKMTYLREVYRQEGAATLESADFKHFFSANRDWLLPYAAFCHLRDTYGTADFTSWPKHSTYNKRSIERLCAPSSAERQAIAFYYYVQYQLHLQLLAVRTAARRQGVIIKGDIPIGISRESVEAWTQPHLFNMDGQAGAPPDAFSQDGQNWGFPTYNWEAMAEEGYHWWVRRFQKMAEYFDAYRIDHVLGFFRIWEIPMHSVHGLLGQFSPAIPMSIPEIERYGLKFNREQMTRPYITDDIVYSIFGYKKELITLLYLDRRPDGRYDLKPEYDTQRKIQERFAGKEGEDDLQVRDGLYRLASCVLFVPDRKYPDLYHPRIAAHLDHAFQALNRYEQDAFKRLHDDYFYHRHNTFWYDGAMQKLPALTQATRMLVCAEDLGMVPACVPWVMNQLRIISLEIQTMPKQEGLEFGLLQNNPYRSVCTIATHDMPTLRQWWDEDEQRAQRFYNHALHNDGQAPHPAPDWLCEDIVARHLFSPSVLCLISLQDWLSTDEQLRLKDPNAERINIPANPRHYWRYRMHLSIEQLLRADTFNEKVAALIENSARA